jgi:hypothetical protein
MRGLLATQAFLMSVVVSSVAATAARAEACPKCGWRPPQSRANVSVHTIDELRRAARAARPSTSILLEDGEYPIDGVTLELAVPGLVLRGRSGRPERVLIRGNGMNARMVALSVRAARVTIADLSISQVGFHGIQVRGETGASGVAIHHVHIRDTGQQLVKGSTAPDSKPCRDGLVACSVLEYTDSAPSDYTDGVDVLNGQGWVVRDNVVRQIRGPSTEGHRAGPAILFWGGSRDTVVERNLIVDCYRGIALGLIAAEGPARGRLDHQGGIIRNNAVCNLNSWADEGIEVNASPGALVEYNSVLVEGKVPWSISIRFPTASARVRNNLTNHAIVLRDGASADRAANIETARRDWFVDPASGDLRLARPGAQ